MLDLELSTWMHLWFIRMRCSMVGLLSGHLRTCTCMLLSPFTRQLHWSRTRKLVETTLVDSIIRITVGNQIRNSSLFILRQYRTLDVFIFNSLSGMGRNIGVVKFVCRDGYKELSKVILTPLKWSHLNDSTWMTPLEWLHLNDSNST